MEASDAANTFFRVAIGLGLLVVFLISLVPLLKRAGVVGMFQNALVQTISRGHVGGRNSVCVIRVAEKYFVLGVSEKQMTLISEISAGDIPDRFKSGMGSAALPSGDSFSERLRRALVRHAKP